MDCVAMSKISRFEGEALARKTSNALVKSEVHLMVSSGEVGSKVLQMGIRLRW